MPTISFALVALLVLCGGRGLRAAEPAPAASQGLAHRLVVAADEGRMWLEFVVTNSSDAVREVPPSFTRRSGPSRLEIVNREGAVFEWNSPSSLPPPSPVAVQPRITATIERMPLSLLVEMLVGYTRMNEQFALDVGDVLTLRWTLDGVEATPLHLRYDPDAR